MVCRDWKAVVLQDSVWLPWLPRTVAAAVPKLLGAWESYVLGQQLVREHIIQRYPYLLGLHQPQEDEPRGAVAARVVWPDDAKKGHWLEALQLHPQAYAKPDFQQVARFISSKAASSGVKDLPLVENLAKRLLRLHTIAQPLYKLCRMRGLEVNRTQFWTLLDESMALHGGKSEGKATVSKAVASGELFI
jgi:hypothetical protein